MTVQKAFEKWTNKGKKNKEKMGFITATYYNKNVMDGKEMYSEAMHYQHDIVVCLNIMDGYCKYQYKGLGRCQILYKFAVIDETFLNTEFQTAVKVIFGALVLKRKCMHICPGMHRSFGGDFSSSDLM